MQATADFRLETGAGIFEVTERGVLHGHVTLGRLMLDRRVRSEHPAPCTDQELTILQHLLRHITAVRRSARRYRR